MFSREPEARRPIRLDFIERQAIGISMITRTLWPACVKSHRFEAQVAATAAAGFDCLAITETTYRDLQASGMRAADVRAMASDHGVRLGHYDAFFGWTPSYSGVDACLEMCSDLGLTAICAFGLFGAGEVETAALVDAFARLCERAAEIDISVELEFMPMWGIPTLAMAWDIVSGAGCSNGSLLLDTWHFGRGGCDLELLRALPAGSIRTVQIADADPSRAGMALIEECVRFRALPGEGALPLREIVQILAGKGGVTDIGPEIFSDFMDSLDAATAARLAGESTARLLTEAAPQW